ncbi:MAG: hypothetical protein PWP73_261, partial [Methanococcus sp.]|nr:hypothetical protein [Methanococcus sp.]
TSKGISNNLNKVNSTNYDSFEGLYFGMNDLGNIAFTESLNLSDSETQEFLLDLESKFNLTDGRIAFNVTDSELSGIGAEIEFYSIDELEIPDGATADDIYGYLVAFSDNGTLLNISELVTGYELDNTTFRFNVTHFTVYEINYEEGESTTTTSSSSSSGGGGRSYDSDISDDIESKVIKNFVSSATVIYGNEIDQQYAEELRERVQNAEGFTISGNAVIVGGPEANGFAKEYNDQFEMPISNDYPGENKGVIQVMTIQDNSGTIIRSYTIVYIAGSDRLGTQAALEYFKTLDELPEGPIMVEWTANGPVVVE